MAEKKDGEGKTPLISAALNGDSESVRLLLDKGANVKARDIFGRTPLIAATAARNVPMDSALETVRLLLEHGADVNAQNGSGRTALMEALGHRQSGRQREMIELLLDHSPDLGLRDKKGHTALAIAGESFAPLLKKAGAKE